MDIIQIVLAPIQNVIVQKNRNMLDKTNIKDWQKELNAVLEEEGIKNQEFFTFMKGKIKRLPLSVEDFEWGVFPMIGENGTLIDIRMVIPIIYDVKSLCVNIHEYTHAYEVYSYLGRTYEWHTEESEQKDCDAEKRYLKKIGKQL